ncbi:MAG: alpha-2-macroglobulin family protein [Pseudomonadota bacterium]|nr:alpha-2-macroglobulin family protein [Pseudomonadota bacterium]
MTSLLLLSACMSRSPEGEPAPAMQKDEEQDEDRREGKVGASGGRPGAPAAEAPTGRAGVEEKSARLDLMKKKEFSGYLSDDAGSMKGLDKALAGVTGLEQADAPTPRAWFPESFLWQPLVEVPESGSVTLPVTVPDTLTTWRLLALGQTRGGAQGGAVASFASTLPAYVDLVAPTFLYAGDVVRLPVQAVSQQADAISASLEVLADGGAVGGGAISLAGYGSRTETVTLNAARAGDLRLLARLGDVDSVERVVPVRPVGRPVEQVRGGTLAGPRSFALSASPGGTSGTLVVTVFPGVLGVARAELDAAPARGDDLANAAYTYAVTGLAQPLAAEGSVTPDVLRAAQLRAWQRIAKETRSPGLSVATTALLAVRLAPADSLAGRLAIRLAETLQETQAPDGLWTAAAGASLDASLVQTARAVWALGPDNQSNRLRATGAFERYRPRLAEPYVAAWALTAGVVEEGTAEALRTTVRDALHTTPDGARTLRVTATRPDGMPVSEAEATALAILALPADDPARPDLAAGLLGLYDPRRGFGGGGFSDGETGLLALRALESVFAGDIPREVAVRVEVDGAEVGRAVLDPAQPHAPVRIVGPGLTGLAEQRVAIISDPAVPGLAFTAVARDYVPWAQAAPAGLDLQVTRPVLVVGQRADLAVSVSAPSGALLDVSLGLPAGVEPDAAALDALVASGRAASWRGEDGRVTLAGLRLDGGAWAATIPVTPTLAGTLLADAARVWPSGQPSAAFAKVPERWTIR